MEREMVLARVARAIGVAGYSVEECDAITSELFGVPPRTPPPGNAHMIVRVVCGTCGILQTQEVQPGMQVYLQPFYSCRCLERVVNDRAYALRNQWRIEMHWIAGR